jgi:hypothetical protein
LSNEDILLKEQKSRFQKLSLGSSTEKAFCTLILINFIFVYFRPQNDLRVLESIKLPFVIGLLPAFAALTRISTSWSKQLKMMGILILQGAIQVPFATNGFWALQGVRALFQVGYGLTLPVAFYFSNGRALKRLFKYMFVSGAYIAFYCLLHEGHGPGDFLGDENDACLVLVIFVAPAIFFFLSKHSGVNRLLVGGTIGMMLAGVVAASSRGGFLGLLCVGSYIFYRSRQKAAMILLAMVIGLAGLFFVPKAYWEDIGTISTQDATAQERLTYWGVSWKMFIDPPNFIWGVGMMNFPWRSGEYEASQNKGPDGKSMSGRKVHSLYFEALPELGLLGCSLLIIALVASLKPSIKMSKQIRKEVRRLSLGGSEIDKDKAKLIKGVIKEGEFAQLALVATNSCFIGMLSGGAFISVLYYPTLWFLLGLSSAVQTYSKKWLALSVTLKDLGEDQFDKRKANLELQKLL